jgi:hypothetical protein
MVKWEKEQLKDRRDFFFGAQFVIKLDELFA